MNYDQLKILVRVNALAEDMESARLWIRFLFFWNVTVTALAIWGVTT